MSSFSDKLLARLVPRAAATAVVCWYEVCPGNRFKNRYCCTGTGVQYCTPC